jgi:gamma-glutamyltranspeptidase/glutathione hydrolase
LTVLLALPLISCGTSPSTEGPRRIEGFAGFVVADEPRAALVGRDVLWTGGTAADAAVATAFALSATLPSQAGLGSGGVCLVYDHAKQSVETLDFQAQGSKVPAMTRGLYALYARYGGGMRWEQLVIPAERMARLGQPVSRALARRLAAWPSGEIDPVTKSVFFRPDGRPLAEGDNLMQPGLGSTLARIRIKEAGALYDGKGADDLAKALAAVSQDAPSAAEIRAFLPQWHPATKMMVGANAHYWSGKDLPQAGEGTLWSQYLSKGDAGLQPLFDHFAARTPPAQAASSGLVAVDRDGSAVACDFTMGRPFGGARLAENGLFLAAPAKEALQPLLATDAGGGQFRFAVAAPAGAGLAAVTCSGSRPDADSCRAGTDPKQGGLASRAGE